MRIKYIVMVIAAGLILACTPRDRYERMINKEIASGERHDSLFLGLRLGMTDKQFYGQCWELNKQGLIRQGTNNTTVLYEIDTLGSSIDMNFYPDFYKGRIWRMPVKFNYEAWAPWNTHLSADSLQQKLLNVYKQAYGDDFMKVRHPERGMAYIKVDGNRQISISKQDDQYVWVVFSDLLVEKELEELQKQQDQEVDGEPGNPLLDALEKKGDG